MKLSLSCMSHLRKERRGKKEEKGGRGRGGMGGGDLRGGF